MQVRTTLVTLALVATLATGARAQGDAADSTRTTVDHIVAVVGARPILRSEVEEQFFQLLASLGTTGPATAADTARLKRQIVEDMVDDELMVQEALRDTAIVISDQEVSQAVDANLKNIRQRFPNEFEFQRELQRAGFLTPDEYRRFMTEQSRRDLLRQRLTQKLKETDKLKPVTPSEQEMQAFFAEQKPQFGKRPATVSFRQVVMVPQPAEAAKARARALADSLLGELRRGADFAVAARRFSQDPGSREQGGDLGWTRRGVWVPEFERVAFQLKPGVVSDPVETPFGFHLIQVQRTQPGEIQARHVLITPELTEADMDSALALAQRVHDALGRGASLDSIQRLHHDPTEEREAVSAPLDKLPEVYTRVLADADSTGLVPPFALDGPGGRRKFAVIVVTERRGEGDIRYEDVKDRVRAVLSDQLATRKYLGRLRRSTFVEVREL
jgi:peptidyl-prolyl cis-trans isomerase SurA